MEIYLSGGSTFYRAGGKDWFGIKHYLATFSDMMKKPTLRSFLSYFGDKYQNIDLFLDSGAFTASTIGAKLQLQEYISFINRYGYMFKLIASLDVIGDAERTLENYLDMKQHTKREIMPTFHHEEPWEYLDIYAKQTNYLAVGNITTTSTAELLDFIPKVVRRARAINPKIKIHAFGVGGVRLIRRIGLIVDSIDTTNWLLPVRWGKISNRPDPAKNELTMHELERFLRHEVLQFTKLENLINDWQDLNNVERQVSQISRN